MKSFPNEVFNKLHAIFINVDYEIYTIISKYFIHEYHQA